MPGIVGIIGDGAPEGNTATLRRMMHGLRHESFYESGHYINEGLRLWLGWINHSGSVTDCMPVWNEANDLCLVLSGETFVDQPELDRLRRQGHSFDSDNASYLIHLYEEMGSPFVEALNGRFSGVLVDLREKHILLFNDRYGFERVYYHENADGLMFASEAKALLTASPDLRQLDLTGFAEMLSCGCPLQNRTIFKGIRLLPAASIWRCRPKSNVIKRSYFRPEQWENQPTLEVPEFYGRFKETFKRILPRYLRGKGKAALSLTGGLDGRMIMAWAEVDAGALPCYTFAGPYRDSRDVLIAQRVAKICKQPHETIAVGPSFLDQFPRLAEQCVYLSDGAMDVSGSVELYVNRIARGIAPVRLTGNYGSEILRGNVAFRPRSMNTEVFAPELRKLGTTAAETYATERHGHRLSFIAFKQVPWHHYSRLAVELSQVSMRSPYLDNDLVALMYQAPSQLSLSSKPSLRLIADGNADLAKIPTDRGLLYRSVPGVSRWRHLFQEFTFKAEYAYDEGMPQWVAGLDHRLGPLHLERLFLGRHKFYHFRVWYRDHCAEYLHDMLLNPRTRSRPYLNGARLGQIVQDHLSGRRNYTSEIHSVLTSELIQRTLIEACGQTQAC